MHRTPCPCTYCGRVLKTTTGWARHLDYCAKNPNNVHRLKAQAVEREERRRKKKIELRARRKQLEKKEAAAKIGYKSNPKCFCDLAQHGIDVGDHPLCRLHERHRARKTRDLGAEYERAREEKARMLAEEYCEDNEIAQDSEASQAPITPRQPYHLQAALVVDAGSELESVLFDFMSRLQAEPGVWVKNWGVSR
ncbi:hypothetical protein PRK78_005724 [Emydomyces testavorans]|uniref:Uncharacterized protein n=1 Tax=Emydomyces testavorans TaxID=2070801 RepID=A0AAF0IMW8_9EURO|nr:hypothetical protein PRK78_005724 [Emydomyces testavorans]